jgi:hypothetical protein
VDWPGPSGVRRPGSSARGLPAEDKRAEGNDGLSVTVAFGSGLNTLPAVEPSAPNNHILPPEIKVRQGGVVHFLMSGFHMATVYNPGTEPENIVVPPSGTFINDPTGVPPSNVFYFGINLKVGRSIRRRQPTPSMVPIGKSRSLFRSPGHIWWSATRGNISSTECSPW